MLDVGCSGHEGAPLKLPSKNPLLGAQLTDGPQIKLELGLFPASDGSRRRTGGSHSFLMRDFSRGKLCSRLPPSIDPRA